MPSADVRPQAVGLLACQLSNLDLVPREDDQQARPEPQRKYRWQRMRFRFLVRERMFGAALAACPLSAGLLPSRLSVGAGIRALLLERRPSSRAHLGALLWQ